MVSNFDLLQILAERFGIIVHFYEIDPLWYDLWKGHCFLEFPYISKQAYSFFLSNFLLPDQESSII